MMTYNYNLILLVLFLILQAFDLYSTFQALKTGVGAEANPVMRRLMGWFGVGAALIIKTLVACIVGGLLFYVDATFQLLLLVLIYAVFMYNNWRVLHRG